MAVVFTILMVLAVVGYLVMIRMPGQSYRGELAALDSAQRQYQTQLQRDLAILAGDIGERNVFIHTALEKASAFLQDELKQAGFTPDLQQYEIMGTTVANIEVEIKGVTHPKEIVVIGAHYDSVAGSPGANDNGTGSVSVLALARAFANSTPARTLRFLLFVNEEPPFFMKEGMGSLAYARRCRERKEDIVAMVSLETMGHFDDRKGSQKYPVPFSLFYPSSGNFIAFVGNTGSRDLVRRSIQTFRMRARFPSEGIATFGFMVTDTAPFRYPHYHQMTDVPDQVDYARLARVVAGLEHVIAELAGT